MTVQMPMGFSSDPISSLSKGRHDGLRRPCSDQDVLPLHEHPSVHEASSELQAAE